MKNKKILKIISKTLFYLLLLLILIEMIFPFYWAINSSFKTEAQLMMTPATMIPRDPDTLKLSITLQNFKAVWHNEDFVRGLGNSAIVSLTVTLLSLCFGSFAAFAFGKLRFRFKNASLYVILAMTMFPQVSVLTGLYVVIRTLNISAIPGMIFTYLLFTLPFTVWVLTNFFKGLPDSLLQAAQVDGATPFQSFYRILLPLTAPALVTTGLLAFIQAWNEYLFALTFTSFEPTARTVPVVLALFSGEVAYQQPFGEIMAAAIIVTLPLLVLVFIFQKKIVEGLTSGAVKG
ncbi:MAG: trehalose/maltose transport system permease protein [Verrucomicrobiota bacterium]|jgi:trehalose/maltose transport system permease protein|nr:trehalose/maltose transport system permease protein [Verrucomicrobiota bacterium]MDK2962962.1 trehalose/maltose transport system permease protein [Verrucomicrobiota bacterium]